MENNAEPDLNSVTRLPPADVSTGTTSLIPPGSRRANTLNSILGYQPSKANILVTAPKG